MLHVTHDPSARLTIAVVAYGIVNVVLYAGLTPLWDGFDEPFHYGYVQYLERHGALPVQGRAGLSDEIARSLALAPASYLVKKNIPSVISFEEYFRLPRQERLALRSRLEGLQADRKQPETGGLNYEAQQAPLAYLVLAPLDWLLSRMHLPSRVLALRLAIGIASVLMTALFTLRLGGQLGLADVARTSALFLVFSCQMFYASVAHIANDWLAVPLFVLVVSCAISVYVRPGRASVLALGLALAAGLLTKAYFLSAVPLACGVVLVLCLKRRLLVRHAVLLPLVCGALDGPWYVRNLALGNLAGMQQSVGGMPFREVCAAAIHFPWGRSALTAARAALWTGNNSDTAFNATTIDLMLLLAVAGLCLRAFSRRPTVPERIVIVGLPSYSAGLAYSAVLTAVSSQGAGIAPCPWYSQPLFPPGLCLLMLGFSVGGWVGRALWAATLGLWAYVISATYLAKLLPLYGGLSSGPTRLAALLPAYRNSMGRLYENLGTISLMPAGMLLCLTALVVAGAWCLAARLSLHLVGAGGERSASGTRLGLSAGSPVQIY